MKHYEGATIPITQILVQDADLEVFSLDLQRFWRYLGEAVHESVDLELSLYELRKASWLLRHDPFPAPQELRNLLESGCGRLESLSSSFDTARRDTALRIVASGRSLAGRKENPLALKFVELLRHNGQHLAATATAVVLVKQSMVSRTASVLSSADTGELPIGPNEAGSGEFGAAECFTPAGYLSAEKQFDRLIAVGAATEFQFRLFTSKYPAQGSWLVHHSWITDPPRLASPLESISERKLTIAISPDRTPRRLGNEELLPAEDDPEHEFDALRLERTVRGALKKVEASEELTVPARAYGLKGGHFIFVGQSESSGAIDVLDPYAEPGTRISRNPVSSISVGTYLLLRVGESEMSSISKMADAIGGRKALALRDLQTRWKRRLDDQLKRMGERALVDRLRANGFKGEFHKYWTSASNIAPGNETDFRILLDFLNEDADHIVPAMSAIRALHHRAGSHFRDLLKREFEQRDLDELLECGFLVASPEGDQGVAKLGAFMVTSISSDTYLVPESVIRDVQRGDV